MRAVFPYITDRGVLCKGCAVTIAGCESPGAEYVDLYLRMSDPNGGFSEHSTPMCSICAPRVTIHDAQDLYRADLAQWAVEQDETPGLEIRAWLLKQVLRHPVEVLGVR